MQQLGGIEGIIALAGGVVAAAVLVAVVLAWRRVRAKGRVAAPGPGPSGSGRGEAGPPPDAWAVVRERLRGGAGTLMSRLRGAWAGGREGDARLADLEEALLGADVGAATTRALLDRLRTVAPRLTTPEDLRATLRAEIVALLGAPAAGPPAEAVPLVVVVAGVNGVGKTTTIAKLAHRYRLAGKRVLLVAADTFRAAAAEQLAHWAERVGADCVRHQAGGDPAAVVHDGLAAAQARGADVVIIDTAGRLHVKQHLVEELKKIVRVIGRQVAGAPHEVLLVLDATTGQNAIRQARVFEEAVRVTGLVLTKLDGTAKGGAVVAIRSELGIPIRFVGVGERLEDLLPFSAEAFVDALLGGPAE